MFDRIDPTETSQPGAEEWRPMLCPAGVEAVDFHHPRLGEPSETWRYRNAAGLTEGYVCRFETIDSAGMPSKEFRPRRYGALLKNGHTRTGWHWKGWGENRPLYGLCELLARPEAPVIVVEGERKVGAAQRLFPKYVAVSPMNGAKSPQKTDWTPTAGRNVTIWPDHDEPGLAFEEEAAKLATDAGAHSVAVVTIPQAWPAKWDLADALPDGVSPETLREMLESAEPQVSFKPVRRSKRQKKPASERKITAEVCRLVTVSHVKYVIEREEVAEKLGIGVSQLDRLVKIERGDAGVTHGDGKTVAVGGSGRPLEFLEIDPWPEPVDDGAGLLADLSKTIREYVISTQAQGDGVALWVMQTHSFDIVEVAPKLLIKSAERRSGKSRLLEVLAHLVPRPQPAANIKSATLFRVIEEYRPTLLLDEVDTYLKDDPELHGIINSGFNKAGAKVLRAVPIGDKWEVREFSTWCPQAIAGIGHMPDTIVDRSFVIEMKRKLPTEKVAKLRRRDAGPLIELARKAARWAADHVADLAAIDPEMPESLNDRAMDAWEFCIAIADLAGGEWPVRARTAARELSGDGAIENESARIKLLADVRDIFEQTNDDILFSWEIVKGLSALNNRSWAEWGRDKKPITPTAMSLLLSPLLPPGIKSGTVRKGENTNKGYRRKDLEDAFSRYLPRKPPSKTSHRHNPQESSAFLDFQNVTTDDGVTLSKSPKAAESATCDGATFQTGFSGGKSANGIDPDAESAPLNRPKPDRETVIL
jgi:hypothetical protein